MKRNRFVAKTLSLMLAIVLLFTGGIANNIGANEAEYTLDHLEVIGYEGILSVDIDFSTLPIESLFEDWATNDENFTPELDEVSHADGFSELTLEPALDLYYNSVVEDEASSIVPLGIVTIVYRGNGHTGGAVPANQMLSTPGSINLRPQGSLVRTGHVFVGWRMSNGDVLQAGSQVSWSTAVAGTLTLDAHWIPSRVTIQYRGNGHTSGTVPANQSLLTPGSINLRPQGNLARTGHVFVGWRMPTGEILQAGSQISWNVAVAGTLTLDAHWIPSRVTIQYRGNGHTSGTVPANQSLLTPGSINLRTQGTLARTGHAFVGWRDSAGNIIQAGSLVTFNTTVAGTLTLDAHWVPSRVDVHYSGNGNTHGSNPTSHLSILTPGSVTLRQPGNLARRGFRFGGWRSPANQVFEAGTTVRWEQPTFGTWNLNANWITLPTSPAHPTANNSPRGPFASADAAAHAWGNHIASTSLFARHEHSAMIYRNSAGEYRLTQTERGNPHSVSIRLSHVPSNATRIAYVHTHPNSANFSQGDRDVAINNEINAYVVAPTVTGGSSYRLLRFNYSDGTESNLGAITMRTLTSANRINLEALYQNTWLNHLATSCGFNCRNMQWPTLI
jgi:uncharacterized repeat protein (TIGR02543 family)